MVTLASDPAGLESLPLRLMIVAIVAGLSIAPAAEALNALESRSFLQRCDFELEELVRASQAVLLEGSGSRRTVDVDLASDGALRVDAVMIGGEWGSPYMSSVVLELSSGRSLIRSANEPAVWLASSQLGRLEVRSDRFDVALAWELGDSGPVVVCEVMPWTS